MNNISYNKATIFVLLVLHGVGLVGLNLDSTRVFFEQISHINIFISLILVLFADSWKNPLLWIHLAVSFIIGMAVEIAGVETGKIFGTYQYTNRFGPEIMNVPIAVGLNWFLLSLCAMNVITFQNKIIRVIMAAALMTGIDFILEPFAVKHNLWVWENIAMPPVQNYFGWFVVSSAICLIYTQFKLDARNPIAIFYLALLVVFLLVDKIVG